MKVHIIGTGGVGGFFGGMLAKAGKDVTFVARGEHYRSMLKDGLLVKSIRGDFHIPKPRLIRSVKDIERPELILIFVKTYDTHKVASDLASIVSSRTIIVTFQNGLENDIEIKRAVRIGDVFPGFAYINSHKVRPGLIRHVSGPCSFHYGSRPGSTSCPLGRVDQLFRSAQIDATISKDIEKDMWIKHVWIAAFSGMTAITRSPAGLILDDSCGRGLFERCLDEAIAVANSQGVLFSREEERMIRNKMELFRGRNVKSSLLVDIENKRRTEAETIHGILVKYASFRQLEIPVIKLIYTATRLYESQFV